LAMFTGNPQEAAEALMSKREPVWDEL
jgi:hypothetical protein